ncbi:hypothetical protein BANRA_02131 [Escherichia coli]|nr:hypothetical protein BANRA_02131 [Escherichia coli]
MYCETAALDQFFWIFVNKDENYHWIAICEASTELLELGMLEYRKAMRAIATGFDTGEWPAPICRLHRRTERLRPAALKRCVLRHKGKRTCLLQLLPHENKTQMIDNISILTNGTFRPPTHLVDSDGK